MAEEGRKGRPPEGSISLAQSDVRQHTIAAAAVCAGGGVHSGRRARIALKPAPADSGVVFVRTDVSDRNNRIPALAANVARTQLNTEIKNAQGVSVSTIEHLMAALAALSVDNVVVEIDGPECPIMDGSAQPFVELLDQAGRKAQGARRRFIEILDRVEVIGEGKSAALSPARAFELDFELRYQTPAIGVQRVALAVTEDSFRRELAPARTFGFLHEVEHLQRLGLALGASLENAVAIDGDRIVNPEGLRMEREFVRHKALDAVGDLYTLGAPIIGRFETVCGGHALNNQLCRALLDRPAAWRVVTVPPSVEMAEAV
jgi:UDP-3-O-[3-hydroxymyristoyl] N-acetylglucosamine deacetylase